MKKIISAVLFAIAFTACNESKKPNENTTKHIDTAQTIQQKTVSKTLTEKEKLIAELNRFKVAVETKNKTEIATFFNFPVADSTLTIYDINADFDKQRIENGNKLTIEMFNDNFERLYEYWDFEEFTNLFKFLKLNELSEKNTLEYVHKPKNEGCYFMYSIKHINNEVTISYGTNTNGDYSKKHPDEEEVCGEYLSAWVFSWNGQKLTFKKQLFAG